MPADAVRLSTETIFQRGSSANGLVFILKMTDDFSAVFKSDRMFYAFT